MLKDDVKYGVKKTQEVNSAKYKRMNYKSTKRIREIRNDVIKFIPFSIFLIIPGAEALLPAWIVIFPNAIPSQFLSDEKRYKRFNEMM